jgi:hypothetical protein
MMRRTTLLLAAARDLDEHSAMEFERMLGDAESEVIDKMSVLLDLQSHMRGENGH